MIGFLVTKDQNRPDERVFPECCFLGLCTLSNDSRVLVFYRFQHCQPLIGCKNGYPVTMKDSMPLPGNSGAKLAPLPDELSADDAIETIIEEGAPEVLEVLPD